MCVMEIVEEKFLSNASELRVGIVVERRETDNKWIDHTWQVLSIIPGAPENNGWVEIGSGEGWVHYQGPTLVIELFRKETEGYRYNLSLEDPAVFVVMRDGEEDCDYEVVPFLATVCPYEAQDYMDSGEEMVNMVAMPPEIAAWVAEFVEINHVDEPFVKRKRKTFDPRTDGFERPPPRVSNKWNS